MGGIAEQRRDDRLPAGAAIILASLVFGSLRQGAYHLWQHQVFVALLALGAILFLRQATVQMTLRVSLILAPLVLSSVVSVALAEARSDAASTFVLIGVIALAMLASGVVAAHHETTVLTALIGVACVVGATAIWGVTFHSAPWGRITEGVWRGSSSLTYSNAAAAILGPVTLLAVIKAAHTDGRLYAVAATFTSIGFITTQSRGGALAFVFAGVLMLFHLKPRRFATVMIPVMLGVAVGAPLLILRSQDAGEPAGFVAIALVAVGLCATTISWSGRHRIPKPHLLIFVGVPLLGLVVGLTGLGEAIAPRLSLRSGTTFGGQNANVLLGDRAKTWEVAWGEFLNSPLFGNGPGEVDLAWVQEGRGFRVMFVHNEYLELAVTHGVFGVGALLVSTVIFIRFVRLNSSTAPLVIALVNFMAHSTFDFLWHIPMLPVFFASVAGVALGLSAHSATSVRPDAPNRSTTDPNSPIPERLDGNGGFDGADLHQLEQYQEAGASGVHSNDRTAG